MPLEPLKDDSGPIATIRALGVLAIGFGTLLPINLFQLLSLVVLPFSQTAFRAINRWCADTWWGLCVTSETVGPSCGRTGLLIPPGVGSVK